MAERLTWCKDALIFTDLFGSRLLGCNIPSLTIQNWLKNPTVQEKGIFDHMYGLAGEECLVVAERLLCKSSYRDCGLVISLICVSGLPSLFAASAVNRRGNLASLLKAKATMKSGETSRFSNPSSTHIVSCVLCNVPFRCEA
jgi:hypothetical protein